MKLSINLITHVLVTFTKTHYFLNLKQSEIAKQVQGTTNRLSLVDQDCQITGSNIAEIMTLQKYYETYPDKRPSQDKPSDFKEEWAIQKPVRPETLKKFRELKNKLFKK